jgi:hypothetical protein
MYVCTIKKAFITFYYTTILLVTPAENIFGEFSWHKFRASFITKLNPVAVYLPVFLNGAWLEYAGGKFPTLATSSAHSSLLSTGAAHSYNRGETLILLIGRKQGVY